MHAPSNPIQRQAQRGSNIRRLASRLLTFYCLTLFAVILTRDINGAQLPALTLLAITSTLTSALYFVFVVISPMFLSSRTFSINGRRLFGDTIISTMLMILSFSLLYGWLGTNGDEEPMEMLYFSAVTFSTLGFGDIAPDKASRFYAAMQALVGNIHLGILVGAAFSVVQSSQVKQQQE